MITRRSVQALLKRKKITGREVGRLQIAAVAATFANSKKPIVSPGELAELADRLESKEDIREYNNFIAISRWTASTMLAAEARRGAFESTVDYFTELAQSVYYTININNYIRQLPKIVTQAQYDDMRKKEIEDFINTPDEAADLFSLAEHALYYYVELYNEAPNKAGALAKIFDKYKKEKVKSPIILSRYNKVYGIGYRELPDGRRSDKMSPEEWEDAISTEELKSAMQNTRASVELTMKKIDAKYNGEEYPITIPTTWHCSAEPPTDLTKWEVLANGVVEFYGYNGIEGEPTDDKLTTDYEDFYLEFKEALDIIAKEALEKYKIDFLGTSFKEWIYTVYDYKSLYNMDFYGYRKLAEAELAAQNIAIIHSGDSNYIDANGYYKLPKLDITIWGIDKFVGDAPTKEAALAELDEKMGTLLDTLYFFKGYELAGRIIADDIELEEYTVFFPKFKDCELRVKAAQNLFRSLYLDLEKIDEDICPYKKEKLDILKKRFCDIAELKLDIPPENIETVKEGVRTKEIFKLNYDKIMTLLTERRGGI